MQRLFATFPDERPGIALLLLRFALAAILIFDGPTLWPIRGVMPFCIVLACFLIIGVCLRIVAITAIIGGIAASLVSGSGRIPEEAFVLSVLASTGLLGAGAYSLDGWLFGRRRVIITTTGKRKT